MHGYPNEIRAIELSCINGLDGRRFRMHAECMARARRKHLRQYRNNPIRRYKDQEGLTYPELAERLGISVDYARKLGASIVTSVSPEAAKQFEERTFGALEYVSIMLWIKSHLDAA